MSMLLAKECAETAEQQDDPVRRRKYPDLATGVAPTDREKTGLF
jgi:hypothetical protein